MKIYIEGEVIEYRNNIDEIDRLMEDIYQRLENSNKILKSMIIDEEEVFVDFGEYIFNNIGDIEEIKVKSVTTLELMQDTLVTSLDYIENALGTLNNIDKNIDYKQISDLLEGLTWLIETFTYMDKDPNLKNEIERKEEWNLYAVEVYKLVEILPEMLESVSIRDDLNVRESIREVEAIFKSMKRRIIDLVEVK